MEGTSFTNYLADPDTMSLELHFQKYLSQYHVVKEIPHKIVSIASRKDQTEEGLLIAGELQGKSVRQGVPASTISCPTLELQLEISDLIPLTPNNQ